MLRDFAVCSPIAGDVLNSNGLVLGSCTPLDFMKKAAAKGIHKACQYHVEYVVQV